MFIGLRAHLRSSSSHVVPLASGPLCWARRGGGCALYRVPWSSVSSSYLGGVVGVTFLWRSAHENQTPSQS